MSLSPEFMVLAPKTKIYQCGKMSNRVISGLKWNSESQENTQWFYPINSLTPSISS